MDVILSLATPSPQPLLGSGSAFLDVRALITTLLGAGILAVLAYFRKAIGKLFRAISAVLKDRWTRFNTPVAGGPLEIVRKEKNDAITERDAAIVKKGKEVATANAATRKARHEREMAVLAMDETLGNLGHARSKIEALRLELKEAKTARPSVPEVLLPARWTHSGEWTGPFEATITVVNRGPGTAYHVLIDSQSGFSTPEGLTYWKSLGPEERLVVRASASGGKSRDTRALKLEWRDAEGESNTSILNFAGAPPGMTDDPEDPDPWNSSEPPF